MMTNMAPSIDPRTDPMPPMITMERKLMDIKILKRLGVDKSDQKAVEATGNSAVESLHGKGDDFYPRGGNPKGPSCRFATFYCEKSPAIATFGQIDAGQQQKNHDGQI